MPSKPPPAPPNHQTQYPSHPSHHTPNQNIRNNQVANGNYQKSSKTFNDMHANNQQNLNQNNNQVDQKPPPVGNKPQRPQYTTQPQPPPKEQTAPVEQKENKV